MKRHKNRSGHKRQLVEAVLRKWHYKRWDSGIRSYKNHFAHAVVVNALGAAAFLTVGTTLGFSKDDPTVLPEVVVVGKQEKDSYKAQKVSSVQYTEPLRDIPQTIIIIPQAVMEDQGTTTMRSVLRNVPGISIQAGEGGVPAGDNLSIRGFSARTDMLVDGVRDFGGYTRDPFNFEQIEVFKGPTSSTAGRGSTGGVINMVSKAPRDDNFYNGNAGFGTDEYKRTTMDLNQSIPQIEGAAVRFNAMYHDANTPGRDEVFNKRWGVSPSIAFGLGTPTTFTLGYFHLDQNNLPDYGVPWVTATHNVLSSLRDKAPNSDWSNFYGLKNRDYEDTLTDMTTATVGHEFNDVVNFRNQFRFGTNYRDSVITAPRFVGNDSLSINRQLQSRDMTDTILANQSDFTFKFDTASIGHSVVTGFEYAHETSKNFARSGPTAPVTGLYVTNPDDPYFGPIVRTGAFTATDADTIAVFGNDTVKLGEHWEINGGVRYDYLKTNFRSVTTANVSSELEREDKMTSWRSGIVYKPVEYGSIYAGYGTSFNPSSEGLTLSSTATATNNIAIDPEENRSIEIGTKWDLFDENLSLSGALFRSEKTNARTEDPLDSTDIIALEGEQRVDGVELGLAGNFTDKWSAFVAYTFMVSEVTESRNSGQIGEELGNTPKNSFSLWTAYQLPYNFEIGGGLQYVDTRLNNVGSSRIAPDYWLADAMLAYQAHEDVTMRLNLYNIGDTEYIDSVGGGHFIPGAGRSAVVSADVKF